jgi:predicted NBD/HSP70 family sugar kinase
LTQDAEFCQPEPKEGARKTWGANGTRMNTSTDEDITPKRDTVPSVTGCGPLLPAAPMQAVPLRRQVFDHVRAQGRTARAGIASALDISAGSVTAMTADLIAAGLLREVETPPPRDPGRGRPRVALEVVAEAHRVIGIKLSDERHSAVLIDLAGNLLAEATLPTASAQKPTEAILAEIERLLDRLDMAAFAATGRGCTDRISAIGIGLPGLVDHATGRVPWSPLLSVRDVALKETLQSRLRLPVHVDNDSNVLTLAELWFGAGRAMSDFAVVTIEHGVGMGMVLNNRLFRGARGMGLELGHTKVEHDGALCRCGRRGCLEAYVADYALAREAATALGNAPLGTQTPSPHAMLEALFAEAKAGNKAARMIFRRAGRYLSVGLSNVVQLFDPALIILSGERMRYDYLYADEVLAEMQALGLPDGRTPARVEIHAWGDLVWARGAGALALSAVTEEAT